MSNSRNDLLTRQQLRKQIYTKGETAYVCDTCARKVRVPTNKYGVSIINKCVITKNCTGHMRPVATIKEAADVPSVPPAVPGLVDWEQRQILHTHTQTIESAVWTIIHNLKNKPSVSSYVYHIVNNENVLEEITPQEVVTIDENTTQLKFERPHKGVAQLLATASAVENNFNSVTSTAKTSSVIITNDGELTIATVDTSPSISFSVRFFSSLSATGYVDVTYIGIDNTPSLNSPWVGTRKVFLGGKSYTVRSFNIRTHELARNAFSNNLIANGSPFYFTFDDNSISKNLVLLGNPPYSSVDRITTSYIDLAFINRELPELSISGNDAIISDALIRKVYPPIVAVD